MGFRGFNGLTDPGIHTTVLRPVTARPPTAQAREEAGVVERARAGDAEARDELVRRYLPDVYRTTAHVLGDRDLAQDAAQDAMVNALAGLPRFRGDSSFRTWLLRIAMNAARSVGRRNGRRRSCLLRSSRRRR